MQPLPLHEIDAELEALEASILEAEGEITDAQDAHLHVLLDAREDKARACVALIRRNAATADAYRAEADRLAARARAHAATAERVKAILLASMLTRGEDTHETPLGRVRVQRASTRPVLLLVDPDDLPERFRRVAVAADKRALTDALKEGDEEALRCAEWGEPSPFLRIY